MRLATFFSRRATVSIRRSSPRNNRNEFGVRNVIHESREEGRGKKKKKKEEGNGDEIETIP